MSVENKDKDKYYGEYAMKMNRELLVFNGDPSVEINENETASTFSAMSKGSIKKSQRGAGSPDKVSFQDNNDTTQMQRDALGALV